MLNFNNLVNDINADIKIEEYLLNFFTKNNFKNYSISELANKNQVKAIKIMFESKKGLSERVDDAFSYDPFCVEALFTYLMISEDVFLQLRFDSYFEKASTYADLDEYEKICYIEILNFYVDFLLDIRNVTKAIVVQKLIIRLTQEYSKKTVSRLAYSYYEIENAEEFYKLYTEAQFGIYEYILCLITLLKNEEDIKAQEVLIDMFKNIEYGTYLDHVWDLDESDPIQKELSDAIQDCLDEINSIPTFFSWVNKIREKYGK